jgi:hypothetical protein
MWKASGVPLLITTILLGAALWLTTATASFAQSYDPDLGDGNVGRNPYGPAYSGGARYFGGVYPSGGPRSFPDGHRRAGITGQGTGDANRHRPD